MSLFRLDKSYFDGFKILTKPSRHFASSSTGVTGAVRVFPLTSLGNKEVPREAADDEVLLADSLEDYRHSAITAFSAGAGSYETAEKYMSLVNSTGESVKLKKQVEILRFEPSFKFTSDTVRKRVIEDVLFPYYRGQYGSTCNWGFTNYQTLNFFTTEDDTVPQQSVMIYPASSGSYRPSGSFSFEFYVNPRYQDFQRNGSFHAGTLFHMSSSYAVSLVSGSSRDINGYIDGFRLLLQLTHSAEVPPSSCSLDMGSLTSPRDYVFSSSDNSLTYNTWHHCCIRWDNNIQNSTGSFVVDGEEKGTFVVPRSALDVTGSLQRTPNQFVLRHGGATPLTKVKLGPPDALFIGNFYEGPNSEDPRAGEDDNDYVAQFFNPLAHYKDGTPNFYYPITWDDNDCPQDPDDWRFNHPLNAEVHELKIYNRYRLDNEIMTSSMSGIENLKKEVSNGLLFYVPPFFVKNTRTRQIFQTPFQAAGGSTDDPFNVPLSFGVGGHYLNLENFVKEFVRDKFPRLWFLSGSTIEDQTGWKSCNQFLFTTASVRKRNLTILPNDNGRFHPNFDILRQDVSSSSGLSLFVDDMGVQNLSLVSLKNLLPTGSIGEGLLGTESPGSISEALEGASPDDPSVPAGAILTIYNRTRDPSSNEIAIFDASNLFYGNKIDPYTYTLKDTAITGSGGRVSITLKDNGRGGLYRADATGSLAQWNSVGTLLYDEGIAVVKTPLLPRFGVDQFDITLKGQQNIHMLRLDVPAEEGNLTLSENPTFESLLPTDMPADKNTEFAYITNVNLLDENLNIICKSVFSQPVVKRVNDRFVIRIKLDF